MSTREGKDILTVLAAVLIADTPIDPTSVLIGKGPFAKGIGYPALQLFYDDKRRRRTANGEKQWTYPVQAVYYGRWENTNRTLDQVRDDAEAVLDQMTANLEANPELVVDGVQHAQDSASLDAHFDDIVEDMGFQEMRATLLIQVPGLDQPG